MKSDNDKKSDNVVKSYNEVKSYNDGKSDNDVKRDNDMKSDNVVKSDKDKGKAVGNSVSRWGISLHVGEFTAPRTEDYADDDGTFALDKSTSFAFTKNKWVENTVLLQITKVNFEILF